MKKNGIFRLLLVLLLLLSVACPGISAAETYSDISGHWAKQAIERFSAEGVIKGSNGSFMPDMPIIRGDGAVIVSRLFGLSGKSEKAFSDVEESSYYSAEISAAAKAGIMTGTSENTFEPNSYLSRQETAVIIARLAELDSGFEAKNIKDGAKIAEWAKSAVNECVGAGIVSGYPDGSFAPEDNITRAEFLTVFDNAFAYISKNNPKEDIKGTAVASGKSPVWENINVIGSIIVSPECESFTLKNCTVSGKVVLLGETELKANSKALIGTAVLKFGGAAATDGESLISFLVLKSGNCDLSGDFENVETGAELKLSLKSASVKSIVLGGENSVLEVDGNSYVQSLEIKAANCGATGVGAVGSATVAAEGAYIKTSKTNVKVLPSVSFATVGDEKVEGGKSAVSPDNITLEGGSSGRTETIVSSEIDFGKNDDEPQQPEEKKEITVYFAADTFILGNGVEDFLFEPTKITTYNGNIAANVVLDVLGEKNCKYSGSPESAFYLSAVKLGEDSDFAPRSLSFEKLPECFVSGVNEERIVPKFAKDMKTNDDGWLGEFDYTDMSGWMYSVNGVFPNVGMSGYSLSDGDVIRLSFTLWGYGADIGGGYAAGGAGSKNYYDVCDVSEEIKNVAENNGKTSYSKLLKKAIKIAE